MCYTKFRTGPGGVWTRTTTGGPSTISETTLRRRLRAALTGDVGANQLKKELNIELSTRCIQQL